MCDHGLDYNVARGPQSRIQQCRARGPRERAQENRRVGRSFADAARKAPKAPRLGLWRRRAQQAGLISCYPANDPKAPCFVHIHGGYWQRGSKEIFACLSEGPLARGWSAALCGYTLAPEATLTQITNELKSAFDWLNAKAGEHGIQGPVIVTGWSAGGHLTSFILDHPKVAAGLAISGVFDLGALRDSPHVNDKVKLSEEEIQKLSPMRRPIVNKPLGIAYGTGERPAMIASSRDYHAYRSQGHVPGDLIPIANTNHFTILDELRQPNSTLTRVVIAMAQYQNA